jgi:hypothetical protein
MPIDFGGVQESPLGGTAQRVNRLGNRWQVKVTLPPMEAVLARPWARALNKANQRGALWAIRQPGLVIGSPGAGLITGAGQAGNVLNIDGLSPGYVFRDAQFFSVIIGERRYVFQVDEPQRVDGTGAIALAIEPALRISPADNDSVEIGKPYLEGHLADFSAGAIDTAHICRGVSFTIREAR